MAEVNIGIFSDRNQAENAIAQLERAGFNPKEMSVIVKDRGEGEVIAQDTGATVVGGATSGAATGAVLGGLAGLLIGMGAITIPGIGALLIGGPLIAALGLTGVAATTVSGAATGAVAGGLVGAFTSLGVPKETAMVYEERLNQGGVLLAVPTRSGDTESKMIMQDNGADQIQTIALNTAI